VAPKASRGRAKESLYGAVDLFDQKDLQLVPVEHREESGRIEFFREPLE
jgi:hypothetical protein